MNNGYLPSSPLNAMYGSFTSESQQETIDLAIKHARFLAPNTILCLKGDLGSGKTTYVKGLTSALTSVRNQDVVSPTFNYLNLYDGTIPVFHFDLYRLKNTDDFLSMGFEEYFYAGGVCCIEWFQRILPILPKEAILIDFTVVSLEKRIITLSGLS